MKDNGAKLFRISRTVTIGGVLLAAYTIIEGSMLRGFGEEEFVIFGLFYIVFTNALLYTLCYMLCKKLPAIEETPDEPKWFTKLFIAAISRPLLIIAFGAFNAVTELITMFRHHDILDNFILGAAAAIFFMFIIPVIPTANMIIILYLYRKNRRKKYIPIH